MPTTPLPDLPIVEVLDPLRAALAARGRAVVVAPPGAGKTTVVPLALLDAPWLTERRILVLEPRRLATRAAARRMSELVGDDVGGLVGYQTRDERRITGRTRVEVLTEGVLTRRLQHDPEVPGVGLIIFDEVHERNLTTDVGLAFTLDAAATLRPDLRIVAMSATAATAPLARLLGERGSEAPVIRSEGRMHPVDVRWLPRRPRERLEPAVTAAVGRALAEQPGDVLVFLPGIGEIRRVESHLATIIGADVDVRPLAGALTVAEQDAALAASPAGRRRVVLATDIAETSLTVAGVRVVVDAGLARAPRFDVGTGMTRLTTVSISRDSAEQRAGRAGRTEPGVAYRLWSKLEHGTRPAHRAPEITEVDLAGLALELAAWGTALDQLAFLDPPPVRALRQGEELLAQLGALVDGRLTEVGRRMLGLPLHPRLARMVATDGSALACIVAALVDERDVLRGRTDELPADLEPRVRLVTGALTDDRADRRAVARLHDRAADIARRAGIPFTAARVDADRTGTCLLMAYPDRLAARRRPGQFQLRTGAGAWVAPDDPLAAQSFLVAADLDGKRANARIRLGAAVDEDDVAAVLARDLVEDRRLDWDTARDDLVLRVERRVGALRLAEHARRPDPGAETTAALVGRVRATRLAILPWTAASTQLRARVALLHDVLGDPWPDWSDAALLSSLDEWLAPVLAGATGRADLDRLELSILLRSLLPWPAGSELDGLAPRTWRIPAGRDVAIDYTADRPTVSVRVQDVFGLDTHPTIVGGRVRLTLALLSPADRPIQVTADLPGFWAGSWADVRRDLAGRYPKHQWPADPARAAPRRLKDR